MAVLAVFHFGYFKYAFNILYAVYVQCLLYITHAMFFCSKKDPELLPKTLPCLQQLLNDENVNVQKKVILTLSNVYKSLLMVSTL